MGDGWWVVGGGWLARGLTVDVAVGRVVALRILEPEVRAGHGGVGVGVGEGDCVAISPRSSRCALAGRTHSSDGAWWPGRGRRRPR